MHHPMSHHFSKATGLLAALLALALGLCAITGATSAQSSGSTQTSGSSSGFGTASLSASSVPSIGSLALKSTGIEIAWSVVDSGQSITGYDISRSDSGNSNTFETIASGVSSTTYLDTLSGASVAQLDSGSRWYYRVRAIIDDNGTVSPTDWSATSSTTLPTLPRASQVQFSYQGPGSSASLYWRKPTLSWSNAALPLSGYAVLRSRYTGSNPAAGTVSVIATPGTSDGEISYTDTPPSDGANYAYAVVARYGIFYSGSTGWFAAN